MRARVLLDVERDRLGAHRLVVVVDRERDAEAVGRNGRELDRPLAQRHRPRDLEVPPRRLLVDDLRALELLREGERRAVLGLDDLHRGGLDHEVVDAEARHRREHVLHGVDLDAVLGEDRAPPRLRVVGRVLGADVNPGAPRQVGAHEDDAVVLRRGEESDGAGLTGVDADAAQLSALRDRALRAHEGFSGCGK